MLLVLVKLLIVFQSSPLSLEYASSSLFNHESIDAPCVAYMNDSFCKLLPIFIAFIINPFAGFHRQGTFLLAFIVIPWCAVWVTHGGYSAVRLE